MSGSLFGRADELTWLRSVADPGALAPPRLVVVEGEAGIGKTSLVRALADDTATRVRWAQGADDGAPPFWVWRQLVPEVRADQAEDRFALFGALRDVVAAERGCLLVVDDVQWADEPSLLALRLLLRDPACRGVVCCATRRTGEAGTGWERVGPDLLSGADVERRRLAGLDECAVADLLRAAVGRELAGDEVRQAARASSGNPLFLRELARLLAAGTGQAGESLAEIVMARVRRLDPPAQRLLRAAALLAEEFELTVVARLLDLPTAGCLPAASQALSAGLLVDVGGGRFRFTHGLVRTVLAAETPLQQGEVAAGRFADAFAACRRAVGLADGAGRTDLVATAALTLDAVGDGTWDRTVQSWCLRALDAPGADEARLLARLAETRFYSGDVAGADAPAARALALAESDADPDALVAALRARQLTYSGPEHRDRRAELARRMTVLGEEARRPAVEMWGRLWAIDVLWEHGELGGIEAETTRLRWCVEQQRSPLAAWHLLVCRAALAQARGELAQATALGDQAFALVAGTGHAAAFGARMSLLGAIGHHVGHPPETFGPPVDLADAQLRAALFARLGPAAALAESGRLDEAAHHYRLAGPPPSWDIPPYFRIPALAVGASVAILLGLRADVAWFRAALADQRSDHVVGGGGAASYGGPVALVLGRCAAALDDLDAAADLLGSALATCERIGAPAFGVEAACELAEVRLRQRRPDAAGALLTRARPPAERMGMTPWVHRIDQLLGRGAGPLTAREREVAELVALGRSNREIAEQLVLSDRTVGNHVQHILTKLGFGNRSQIAAWVTARGR